MIILAIETSCDETALALLEARGGLEKPEFKTIATSLFSQIKLHEQYGGVVPMLAKREHQKNLVPLFEKLIAESGFTIKKRQQPISESKLEEIKKILEREQELLEHFLHYFIQFEKPEGIEGIAVTEGPGLEPALWVGISFAKALSALWDVPIIATNHMAGHIYSVLLSPENSIAFPALALLISGGHTELVLVKNWEEYQMIGATRDDAVGEAFDKVARILGLPYPGGPQISKLAEEKRKEGGENPITFPRPMIHSNDFDFSFAGLKTSVLYKVKEMPPLRDEDKKNISCEFENACAEVLISKTRKAIEKFLPKTLILGGGVVANTHIRREFEKLATEFSDLSLFIPTVNLATDNAVMIGAAGYIHSLTSHKKPVQKDIIAQGNLQLDNR